MADSSDKIKNNREKFQEALKSIQPTIEKLVRQVNRSGPGTIISGFIFSQRPVGFVKFGNAPQEHDELIRLHVMFASVASDMKMFPGGMYRNVPFIEIGEGTELGEKPEDVADELATELLTFGIEESRRDEILLLAQRYIMARRQTDAPTK